MKDANYRIGQVIEGGQAVGIFSDGLRKGTEDPRGKPAEECPAGPQYKAHGNGMAVPVVKWIMDRMRISMEAAE